MNTSVSNFFYGNYSEARTQLLEASKAKHFPVMSYVHPTQKGAQGEALAIDMVRVGTVKPRSTIIVTSGVHGAEGFCGSGCQIALLNDDELLGRIAGSDVALLLIHAVNPYGFSHLRRVNESNIDLNRNFLEFDVPLPVNAGYADVHSLMLPDVWPPAKDNEDAVAAYIAEHGARQFQNAVSTGQSAYPDGLFFAGTAESWSNRILRCILREQAAHSQHIAWIDIHTGLGPSGHGEKIFAGRDDDAELARARACWGADVMSPFTGDSFSEPLRGCATTSIYQECPEATAMAIALEYGTLDFAVVLNAIRADQWLSNHPEASPEQRAEIKAAVKDAFIVDSPEWRGMVYAQARVAVLQAVLALKTNAKVPNEN